MEHADAKMLLEAYAFGALDERESAQVEAHVATGCAECAAAVRELFALASRLADSVPQHDPAPHVKAQLMAKVRASGRRANPLVIRPPRLAWTMAGLATAAVLILGLMAVRLAKDNSQLRRDLALAKDVTALLASPGMQFVDLKGVDPNPQAFGKVVLDPERGAAVVYMYRLPQTPEGKRYQLWIMRDGKPTSAGLFSVSSDGNAMLALHELRESDSLASFMVTIEPVGGQNVPTGMMYLTGPSTQ